MYNTCMQGMLDTLRRLAEMAAKMRADGLTDAAEDIETIKMCLFDASVDQLRMAAAGEV